MKDLFKKFNTLFAVMLLSVSLMFVGCSDDDDPVKPKKTETEILLEYLETEAGDHINKPNAIVPAQEVYQENLANPTNIKIIDIRDAATFATGHIKNAENVTLANLYDYMSNLDANSFTKIYIVCFTGQTSGYATTLLKYLGYNNVFSMGYGMSAWHEDFAAGWRSKLSNARATQITAEDTPPAAIGALPSITTGKTNGKDILIERVKFLLNQGFPSVGKTHDQVFADLNGFYIVNYWPYAQYKDPGHIPGAVNFIPQQDLKSDKLLKTIPINKPSVFYCYTGQGSAFTSAYLRLLGYDAYSLLYGASSMFVDILQAKGMPRFSEGAIKNFDYEK